MGLLEELGYLVRSPNLLQRLMQKIPASRPGAWLFQRTLYPVDRELFKLTHGRVTVAGLLAGLPVILLTTTGARSGKARTLPVLGIPLGEDLAVIGSNYGQLATPGWVYNLEKNPNAIVVYGDRSASVVAQKLSDAGSDDAFRVAAKVYPGYANYRTRAKNRSIRSFLLKPAS